MEEEEEEEEANVYGPCMWSFFKNGAMIWLAGGGE